MDRDEWKKVAVALKSKPSQHNLQWDEVKELYMLLLADVPGEVVHDLVVWIIRDCKVWRPTTDQVFDFVSRLAGSPDRSGYDVVNEVRRAIARYGPYGRRDPERPRVRVSGMPKLSSGAARFVALRGGWETLCASEFKSEEWFWKEAAEEADRICESMKIEGMRHRQIGQDGR